MLQGDICVYRQHFLPNIQITGVVGASKEQDIGIPAWGLSVIKRLKLVVLPYEGLSEAALNLSQAALNLSRGLCTSLRFGYPLPLLWVIICLSVGL